MDAIKAQPVFVVGIIRSGTSLLYSLLNQHPKIALMYECDIWDFPQLFSGARFKKNWLQRQEFYNGALSRHRVYPETLESVRTPADLYRAFSQDKQAAIWGEKSPFYCTRLWQLAKRFPDCSFIVLWRDPVEVCQSIKGAGRRSRFFRRVGMLSRLIYHQEQLITQTAKVSRSGTRVHHLTYDELTEDTEAACRGICEFLGINFDPRMLDLTNADFSAVYPEPPHDHLRRGIIERRRSARELLKPMPLATLRRFHTRWNRLTGEWLRRAPEPGATHEPRLLEQVYYRATGRIFAAWDDCKRALFEFLPLSWLATYRAIKKWFRAVPMAEDRAQRGGLGKQLSNHWITLGTAWSMVAIIGFADWRVGSSFNIGPLYVVPLALLTLVVNQRWGTLAAIVSALVRLSVPIVSLSGAAAYATRGWNCLMRFIVLQAFVLLLDRIRGASFARAEMKGPNPTSEVTARIGDSAAFPDVSI